MNKVFAPTHFKRSFGDPKRFRELRHHFKASATAQYLIDYAVDHNITLLDSTKTLKEKGLAGSYNYKHRVITFSHHEPMSNLFHEFRHPQQLDTLNATAPDMIEDLHHSNLRRAFMAVAILEADACFYEDTVRLEMQGQRQKLDPILNYRIFLSNRVDPWLRNVALHHYMTKSIFKNIKNNAWRGHLQDLERAYDIYLLNHGDKKLLPLTLTAKDRATDIDYLHRYTDIICRAPNGSNYLFDGMSSFTKDDVLNKIWNNLFNKERQRALRLSLHKDKQNEWVQGLYEGLSNLRYFG